VNHRLDPSARRWAEMPISAKILPLSRDPRRVAVFAYDGLGTFEFGIAVELFGLLRTNLGVKWYDFEVFSLERGPIRAAGGILLQARRGFRAVHRAGTIVIPGWRAADEPPPASLVRSLRKAYAEGARLVSICSGVFVLAATGLLDGKRATTHWRYTERLISRFPKIRVDPDVLYTDDSGILTSAGSAAGIDLCLHIVRCDFGPEIANEIARRLGMPPHREGGQAQYVRDPIRRATAGGLAPLMQWAESHLDEALRVEDLAQKAAMSPRTFARRFREQTGTTPHQWLMHQRVVSAQRRLEQTTDSIDQVAEAVGLETAATLRQYFSRVLRTTPSAYRRQFSTRRVPRNGIRILD
jgi:AraC family transcriptional regulator, transcriptional activator FtrA